MEMEDLGWHLRHIANKLNSVADDLEKNEDYQGYSINININSLPEYDSEPVYYSNKVDKNSKILFLNIYNH